MKIPIEFTFRPRRAFIRQREVGRDTPSFEQALLDSLREDPDVLMVGEMREPETMRLTLTPRRPGIWFWPRSIPPIAPRRCNGWWALFRPRFRTTSPRNWPIASLASFRSGCNSVPALNICVPECEVLMATLPIKNFIRNREFFKIISSLETGRRVWHVDFSTLSDVARQTLQLPCRSAREADIDDDETGLGGNLVAAMPARSAGAPSAAPSSAARPGTQESSRIDIEPTEIFERILKRPS